VQPTTSDLEQDLSRPLPWLVRVIGAVLDVLPWTIWNILDAEELLEKGAKDAGLPALYPPSVRESVEVLCASLRKENVTFHWIGRLNMHDTIVSGLSHLLQVEEAHRQNPALSEIQLKDPLVVVGIPRSGTTVMHNLLSKASDCMFLPLWEHVYPAPPRSGRDNRRMWFRIQFVFWKWVANNFGMDSVHYLEPDLPDECTFSLRLAGVSHLFWSMAPVYDYLEWLHHSTGWKTSYLIYRKKLQMMQALHPQKRLVLKCPSHAFNLPTLTDVIPEAHLIFTHRSPQVLAASEASLIARLQATSVKGLDWKKTVRHNARKNMAYSENMVKFAMSAPASKIFHVPYWRLVTQPEKLVGDIHRAFDLPFSAEHARALSAYLTQNSQGSKGKHNYSVKMLEQAGLTEHQVQSGFKRYATYFANYLETKPPPKPEEMHGAPLSTEPALLSKPEEKDAVLDVIVIGGGLSGLACAQRLLSEQPDASVLVLEAAGRVGGRAQTVVTPKLSCRCDVGGAYVGPTQDRILRVARNLGVETYKVYTKGRVMFNSPEAGGVKAGTTDVPPVGVFGLLDFNALLVTLERMALEIDTSHPYLHPNAAELDAVSVKEWVDTHSRSPAVRTMFARVLEPILCKSAEQVSMLYFLWYARSGDSLKRLMDVTNGAQERKLAGGSQQIAERMASAIGGVGGMVLLQSPVSAIHQRSNPDGVSVTCCDGRKHFAKRVVLAVPPNLYSNIKFTPELPASKLEIAQRFSMGRVVKTVLFYKRAWWRDLGLNGQIFDVAGPVLYSMDDCGPEDGMTAGLVQNPALMGFVTSDEWIAKTAGERQEAIAQQYAKLLGSEEAMDVVEYAEKEWLGSGCTAIPEKGRFVTTAQNLRTPVGRVHFAGTELATHWSGYMDGAVQSGERAAQEVLAELCGSSLTALPAVEPQQLKTLPALPGALEKALATVFDACRL